MASFTISEGRNIRFSTARAENPIDSWYHAINGKVEGFEEHQQDCLGERKALAHDRSTEINYTSDDQNSWFYNLNGYSAGFNNGECSYDNLDNEVAFGPVHEALGTEGHRATRLLPSLPNSESLDFEYLFGHAPLHPIEPNQARILGDSPDDLSFRAAQGGIDSTLLEPLILSPEDVSSPASEPLTTPPRNSYGQTNFKTCAWNHTKVDSSGFSGFSDLITRFDPTTSRDQGLSLIPANDHSEEFDDTPALFQGFPVEEAPSPFHAPVVGETPDFTDSRDGAVGFPMRWESNIAQPESCSIEAHDVTFACNGPKLEAFLETQSTTNEQKRPLSPMSVVEETGAKPKYYEISRYSDVPSGCRKRRARDSFSTESTYEAGRDDRNFPRAKRLRFTSWGDEEIVNHSPHAPRYSLITNCYDAEEITETEIANPGLPGIKPNYNIQKGFPGQFHSVAVEATIFNTEPISPTSNRDPKTASMGDYLHPNYVYTHTNFHACEDVDLIDYQLCEVPTLGQREQAIQYAYDKTCEAGELNRTASQERLRREVHLECTSARLEGVAVGRYRYYQGHLNVEEYKDARICICWEMCACSKMCTRFADIICPCSKYIEIHEQ